VTASHTGGAAHDYSSPHPSSLPPPQARMVRVSSKRETVRCRRKPCYIRQPPIHLTRLLPHAHFSVASTCVLSPPYRGRRRIDGTPALYKRQPGTVHAFRPPPPLPSPYAAVHLPALPTYQPFASRKAGPNYGWFAAAPVLAPALPAAFLPSRTAACRRALRARLPLRCRPRTCLPAVCSVPCPALTVYAILAFCAFPTTTFILHYHCIVHGFLTYHISITLYQFKPYVSFSMAWPVIFCLRRYYMAFWLYPSAWHLLAHQRWVRRARWHGIHLSARR